MFIDLVYLANKNSPAAEQEWDLGKVFYVREEQASKLSNALNTIFDNSNANYILIWNISNVLPDATHVLEITKEGIDLAHAGLRLGTQNIFPELYMVKQDWGELNASSEIQSTNWRMSLDACLIRTELFRRMRGLDSVFASRNAMGLDFGLRSMQMGGLVEYSPKLLREDLAQSYNVPTESDFYLFVLRHYGMLWGKYVFLRQTLFRLRFFLSERKTWKEAAKLYLSNPRKESEPVWFGKRSNKVREIKEVSISVIIPTLGRYSYLKQALDSMRNQTIKPFEIIVVDQNSPEEYRSDFYKDFDDIGVKIIWQDKQGQSLARNTGVNEAQGKYIFLFDDDSIADPNLIEAHINVLLNGRFDVSTGVSYPPPPSDYQLPHRYRFFRVAQTFDTGNSMLSRELYQEMRGLDRNYDFGPGTDMDFGTRLYLSGYRIAHNPYAKRIHFKAPVGGLRLHGSYKYNSDLGLFSPFPPITQSYYGLRYLSKQQTQERAFIQFVTSKFPEEIRIGETKRHRKLGAMFRFGISFLFFPIKLKRSNKEANALFSHGVRLMDIETVPSQSQEE